MNFAESPGPARSGFIRWLSILILVVSIAGSAFSARKAALGRLGNPELTESSEWGLLGLYLLLGLLGLLALWKLLKPSSVRASGPNSAWLVRTLFYLISGAVLVALTWFYPVSRPEFEVWVGLPFGLLCALAWLAPRLGPRLPAKSLRALDLLLFNLCLTIVLIEFSLVALGHWSNSIVFRRIDPTVTAELEQYRFKPGQILFGMPCDENGMHDQPVRPRADHERLAVMIGDSFGVGIVPHLYHYSSVAERRLPWMQVYSLAVCSVGPDVYRYLLQTEALKLKPDVIVLGIFVGNDIDVAYIQRPSSPPLYWYVRPWLQPQGWMSYLVPSRLALLARERGAQGRVGLELAEAEQRSEQSAELILKQEPQMLDPLVEVPSFSEPLFNNIETTRVRVICQDDPLPYDNFFKQMKGILAAAGETPLVVVLLPDEFQVEDELWEKCVSIVGGKLDRERPQKLLVPWFEARGVPCLDLLPILRAQPTYPDGKRHFYRLRDTHFNARGNRVVGEALAEFLEPYGPKVRVERLVQNIESLRLTMPGLPANLPVELQDAQGRRWPLAAALPRARIVSSAPDVVFVATDGRVVAQRRGQAVITIAVDDQELSLTVEASWPALVQLGGGTGQAQAGQLHVLGERFEPGDPIIVEVSGLRPEVAASLCLSARPAAGWVRGSEPFPYAPAYYAEIPFGADEQGHARLELAVPDSEEVRGRPMFLTVRSEGLAAEDSALYTPVLALTPE